MDTTVKPLYFIYEALINLKRNLLASVIAISTVALSLVVLGTFITIAMNISSMIKDVESKVEITVFLFDSATSDDVMGLESGIRGNKGVSSIKYISKDDAMKELQEQYKDNPDMLKAVSGNPLPASFRVKLKDPEEIEAIAKKIKSLKSPVIEEIDYGQKTVEKLFAVTKIFRWIGGSFILLLWIASLVVIANTIRLAIFARREEIGIMKLVGATNWFIRWPFILEGVIQGFIGALLAIFGLFLATEYVFKQIEQIFKFLQSSGSSMDASQLAVYLIIIGITIGSIGSVIALRRFLRV